MTTMYIRFAFVLLLIGGAVPFIISGCVSETIPSAADDDASDDDSGDDDDSASDDDASDDDSGDDDTASDCVIRPVDFCDEEETECFTVSACVRSEQEDATVWIPGLGYVHPGNGYEASIPVGTSLWLHRNVADGAWFEVLSAGTELYQCLPEENSDCTDWANGWDELWFHSAIPDESGPDVGNPKR